MNERDRYRYLSPEQAEQLAERARALFPFLVTLTARIQQDFDLWEQEMQS